MTNSMKPLFRIVHRDGQRPTALVISVRPNEETKLQYLPQPPSR